MPSGKTHVRIDIAFLLLLVGTAVYFQDDLARRFGGDRLVEHGAVFALAYLFGTFLLSPDLDLKSNASARNWGIFRVFWRPYAALFDHRGISHMPVLGTLTRILYICVLAYVAVAALNAFFDLKVRMSARDLGTISRSMGLSALIGLCAPDLLHVLTDRILKR